MLFILYVQNQEKSRDFYKILLDREPILDVEGMTEFQIDNGSTLGLMSNGGIKKLLGSVIKDPQKRDGIPACELYIRTHEIHCFIERSFLIVSIF